MLTRQDVTRLQNAGLKTQFFKGFDTAPTTMYMSICTEIPSNGASEDYAWLGETNGLKEWKDERVPHALLETGFSLRNKDYEDTIAVDRNAIQDEKYGQIKIRVGNMGTIAKQSYDEILTAKIEENGLCYDGQNFFDTDHEEGLSGVQSNVATSGMAFTAENVQIITSRMKRFKMSNGKRAKIKPSTLMVPSDLEWAARIMMDPKAVSVTTDPSKAIMKDLLDIMVNDELENDGVDSKYYVLDLKSRGVKPFIFQNREAITFTSLDNPNDQDVFMRKTIYYGVHARFAFGYGDWRQAYRAQK